MTGRYSLENSRERLLKDDIPELGSLFQKNGYYTGIIGKYQPHDKDGFLFFLFHFL